MAYSSSIKLAQAIKLCELCEENRNLKWRCVDCDKCLCDKCKNIHLKVTAKHQIVSIKTPLQDIERKIIIDNIPCEDHDTKMICMFCKTCKCLICPICISSGHRNHNFIPLENVIEEKQRQLKDRQTDIAVKLKSYDVKTKYIQNVNLQYDSVFDESLTKIKEREQELKSEISEFSQVLQTKVKLKRSNVKRTVFLVEQQVTKAKKMLEDQRNDIETILVSNQGKAILKSILAMEEVNFDSIPNEVELFIPEAKLTPKVPEIFGSFIKTKLPIENSVVIFEVLRTFTTDLQYIHQVVCLDATTAWISAPNDELLRLVKISGNKLTTSNEIPLKAWDMTLTCNSDILLTESQSNSIMMLSKLGQIKTFHSMNSFFPVGIQVTKNNEFIVSVPSSGDQSQWSIMVFGMDRQQKQIIQFNETGEITFSYPFKITTNINQDILIIDGLSEDTGRVVCLNREANLRWIYTGHPELNLSAEFEPVGMVTTSEGYIIVCDNNNHALHILSEDGELVACKVMESLGLINPWALDIDKDGQLWVCCGHEDNPDIQTKIHIVKFSI